MKVAAVDAPVFPQELIVEILSWAQVKALMRFRCVSKFWNSLIFDRTFIKLHSQRTSKNTHILLTFDQDSSNPKGGESYTSVISAPCSISCLLKNSSSTIYSVLHLLENPSYTTDDARHGDCHTFLGSCNGLVCLLDCIHGDEFEEYIVRFWNPATRFMSGDSPRLRVRSCNYEFVKYAFGYDDLSDTYKVVVLIFNINSQNWELKVHSMGETYWRNVLTCPAFPILQQVNGQFVSGTLNWSASLSSDYQRDTVSVDELVIFSYDLKKETFSYLSMPDGLSEVSFYEPSLSVLNGCLCLCLCHDDHMRTNFVIWHMREFGAEKSWIQLLNVSFEHIQALYFPPSPLVPLCKSENEDIMLLADFGRAEFVLVDKEDNRVDRIQGFKNKKGFKNKLSSFNSFEYVHSLVLPFPNQATFPAWSEK